MRLVITLLLTAALACAAIGAIAPEKIENVRALLRARNIDAAESAAKALVAAHPRDADAHGLLGAVCMAKGDPDGAVKASEKAAELAPASSEVHRQLGDAYGFAAQRAGVLSKMGLGKKCRLSYEKAVELDPKNIAARSSLMTFYQMAPGIAGGGMDKAYEQAAAIKKIDAGRGSVAYALLYTAEKKYAEAFKELEAALKAAPDQYPMLFQIGRTAALSGERVDRGMEALQKCLTLAPPAGSPGHDAAHWRLGNLWEKKGDKKAARTAYQAALAVNPGFPQAIEALKKLD
jgi:tetratricopeptide (TPR) repeat protein